MKSIDQDKIVNLGYRKKIDKDKIANQEIKKLLIKVKKLIKIAAKIFKIKVLELDIINLAQLAID